MFLFSLQKYENNKNATIHVLVNILERNDAWKTVFKSFGYEHNFIEGKKTFGKKKVDKSANDGPADFAKAHLLMQLREKSLNIMFWTFYQN